MFKGRQQQLAALLGVVAVGALVYQFWPSTVAPAAPPVSTGPSGRSAAAPAQGTVAPDVRVRDLGGEHPAPGTATRNLFRFLTKPTPAPTRPSEAARPPAPTGPPPPPAVPPIPLKFIGVAEKSSDSKKIAILSDARGTYWGREGEIVEGRYRILRIGVESIEMAYVDGRGRQVIRLTGS